MRRFAELFDAMDRTTSTKAKVNAMVRYFAEAPPADAAWAVYFLTGRRLKRLVPAAALREWTLQGTGLPPWLLAECDSVVGDGAETIALILDQLDPAPATPCSLAEWVEGRLLHLRDWAPSVQQAHALEWWRGLDRRERFLLVKLITGELRLGVSQPLVIRALTGSSGLPASLIATRLMGEWTPSAAWFGSLTSADTVRADVSTPYPFFLASPLEAPIATLGSPSDWLTEWKWDGIRAQLVRRAGQLFLWSRGEELITLRFPEITAAATQLPDGTVLDGEVLAFGEGRPLPFSALQQRIGRVKQVAELMRRVPVVFMTYDCLERGGEDIRDRSLRERRSVLESLLAEREHVLRLSDRVTADNWDALSLLRAEARTRRVEGFMLKRWDSRYGTGRKRGDWWKWKIDPLTIDAVLMYAQPGSGRRASLLTDYTFGVWDGDALIPVAKAYSGLTNEEIDELDRWIRRHTVQRFGPVRHVEPSYVFELRFEAIAKSSRHRSGVAVRFPRMLRWRKDKPAVEADTLKTLEKMLPA